jgi:hypothetical protein
MKNNIRSSFLGETRRPPCWRMRRDFQNPSPVPTPDASHQNFVNDPNTFRYRNCRMRQPASLSSRGLRFLELKQYPAAVYCFRELVRAFPNDFIARYNLACAHSLLSTIADEELNQNLAIEALRQSIVSGYSNLQHMEQDADLDPIRNRPEYQQIVEQLGGETKEVSCLGTLPIVDHQEELAKELEQQEEPEPSQEPQSVEIEKEKPQQQEEQPQEEQPQEEEEEEEKEQQETLVEEEFEIDASVRYAEELRQLSDMGFLNLKANLELIQRFDGDIFRVIENLLA